MADYPLIVDIPLEDVPATSSLAGHKYSRYLPVGSLWKLVRAEFYVNTAKTASTTNCIIWRLYDSSGNVMASQSGYGAIAQQNEMTLASSYLTINCATSADYVYAS